MALDEMEHKKKPETVNRREDDNLTTYDDYIHICKQDICKEKPNHSIITYSTNPWNISLEQYIVSNSNPNTWTRAVIYVGKFSFYGIVFKLSWT